MLRATGVVNVVASKSAAVTVSVFPSTSVVGVGVMVLLDDIPFTVMALGVLMPTSTVYVPDVLVAMFVFTVYLVVPIGTIKVSVNATVPAAAVSMGPATMLPFASYMRTLVTSVYTMPLKSKSKVRAETCISSPRAMKSNTARTWSAAGAMLPVAGVEEDLATVREPP